ncbi:DUF1934 domain-containing protein [Clostridium sp.]|uniref:DUF1934 domain-containing protein n=1 Tax=Clostridium sp. TaxID=1506 RepID=UPI00260AD963|nr:DUF1934 domain-containing protein [Clostridium sp.]
MSKKAYISLKSSNNLDKEEVIEVVTLGEFIINEDGFRAVYEETEISGMGGTTTNLIMLNDELILEREGSTTAKMNFKKGENSISLYNTPYGLLDLQVHTEYLLMDVDENGGNIVVKYTMDFGEQDSILTNLVINIKIKSDI